MQRFDAQNQVADTQSHSDQLKSRTNNQVRDITQTDEESSTRLDTINQPIDPRDVPIASPVNEDGHSTLREQHSLDQLHLQPLSSIEFVQTSPESTDADAQQLANTNDQQAETRTDNGLDPHRYQVPNEVAPVDDLETNTQHENANALLLNLNAVPTVVKDQSQNTFTTQPTLEHRSPEGVVVPLTADQSTDASMTDGDASNMAGDQYRQGASSDMHSQPDLSNPGKLVVQAFGEHTSTPSISTVTNGSAVTPALPSSPAPITPASVNANAIQTNPLLPNPNTSESDSNVARVIRGMQGVINQNGGSVTLRLSPPEMGIVRIEMQMNHGTVNAQLHTEHESARTLLSQQLGHLRYALEAQGLSVERLHVQTISQDHTSSFASDRETGQAYEDGRSKDQYASTRDDTENDKNEYNPQHSERDQDTRSSFDQTLNTVG